MIKLCAFADEASANLQGQITALKENGISFIEVRNINGKNVSNFTNEEVLEYKKAFDENGISVWSIGSPLGKVDISVDFNEYLKVVKRVYEIANMFNAKRVRAFSFFNALESKQEVISRLQVLSNLAKDYGLIFCHENEKDIYGDELSRVLEIATEVENLKLVYDPANYLQCNQNATECLQKTLTFTEYFHIKDVILKTGEIVPAGYGDGDISGLINTVKNRNAVLTLEPHLKVFDGYGDIDSTEMKNRFEFKTNREAFDCAVSSLKKIIFSCGYKEEKGEFTL